MCVLLYYLCSCETSSVTAQVLLTFSEVHVYPSTAEISRTVLAHSIESTLGADRLDLS